MTRDMADRIGFDGTRDIADRIGFDGSMIVILLIG